MVATGFKMMNKISKIALIISFVIIGLFTIFIPQYTSSWEVSMYHHLPGTLLTAALFVCFISISGAIRALYYEDERTAILFLFPLLTIFTLLPLLPRQLGYVTRYGDPITHARNIRDINVTGEIPNVIYPQTHILGSSISQLTGVHHAMILEFLGVIMVVMVILMSALIARQLSMPMAAALLFVPVTVFASTRPSPFAYATIFLLGVYLLFRNFYSNGGRRHLLLLLVTGFALVPYHVMPAAVFGALLFATIFLSLFKEIIEDHVYGVQMTTKEPKFILGVFLAFCLSMYIWWTFTWLFRRATRIGLGLFGYDVGGQFLSGDDVTSAFEIFGFGPIDIVLLGLKRFGDLGVMLGLASLAVLVVAIYGRSLKCRIPIILAIVVPLSGIYAFIEFSIGVIPSVSFVRALRPGLFLGPALAGVAVMIFIYIAQCQPRKRSILTGIICVALVTSGTAIAGANAYQSPWLLDKNDHFIDSDVEGMDWYYENKEREIDTAPLWRSNDRYMDYLMLPDERADREEELHYRMDTNDYRIQDHFGYDQNETAAETIECAYYIGGDLGRATYLDVWSETGEFVPENFEQLEADPTVNKLYENGNVDIRIIGCN